MATPFLGIYPGWTARWMRSASLVGWVLLVGGCQTASKGPPPAPVDAPRNVYAPEAVLPTDLRRVALLPIYAADTPQIEDGQIDLAMKIELLRQERFEVVPVDRQQMVELFGRAQFDSTEPLPPRFLDIVRGRTGAQAVMMIDLTTFRPYPPLTVGLRAKLVSVRTGDILWSVDDVVSTDQAEVAEAVRRQSQRAHAEDSPLRKEEPLFQSPSRFVQWAAARMFNSLPTRN